MIRVILIIGVGFSVTASNVFAEDAYGRLLDRAAAKLADNDIEAAVELLTEATKVAKKDPRAFMLRGSVFESSRRYSQAADDYSRVIELRPNEAAAYHRRGTQLLALGEAKRALADFDRYLELEPQAARSHWQRGIACYYAGEYDEGRKQFEAYQTFDDADVENAVWRFLCMARKSGVEKARAEILNIGDDRRVPMRQIYDLFAGEVEPDAVLAACQTEDAEALNRRLFYAHQYLGLFYEVHGEPEKARKHTVIAAEKHKIAHYMWDIAHMHAKRFEEQSRKRRGETPGSLRGSCCLAGKELGNCVRDAALLGFGEFREDRQ